MQLFRWSVVVIPALLALSTPARADAPSGTAPSAAARETSENPVAIGVNSPVGWYRGTFGASLYVGFAGHHAVRGNFTRYEDSESPLLLAASLAAGAEGTSHSGPVTDYGISYVWYPRALWSGIMFEVGALRRDRDILVRHEDFDVATRSTTYAVRGMVGWSWTIRGRAFVAAAVGFSSGRETGSETVTKEVGLSGHMSETSSIKRQQPDGEAYLRIGFTLDP
jgi:hypothetical protein